MPPMQVLNNVNDSKEKNPLIEKTEIPTGGKVDSSSEPEPKLFNNITETIGSSPFCRLSKIPASLGVKCNVFMKLEYLSAGGSSLDNIALELIETAEQKGLTSGQVVVASAGANIAVGLAVVCAAKGYRFVIAPTGDFPRDVATLLNALGAKIIPSKSAEEYAKVEQGSYLLDICSLNTKSGFAELYSEMKLVINKADYIFLPSDGAFPVENIAVEFSKDEVTKVIFVETKKDTENPRETTNESISELRKKAISSHSVNTEKVAGKDAVLMARRLIREEGLMVGLSTGATVAAALTLAKNLPENTNIVIIAEDGIRNYMNHFIDDQWLLENKMIESLPNKIITPNSTYDPACLIYDPTTIAGKWLKDESGKWTDCVYQFKKFRLEKPFVVNNVLEAIGNTPLVKLQKLPKMYGVDCNVYVKCEFMNPGNSIKDRIAARMIELAEQDGRLMPGMTIIEATSGNTGTGLALAAAVKGYRCIVCMTSKMSREKSLAMEALGAIVVRTPREAASSSPESLFGVALRLQKEIPGSIILDQYRNLGNPMVHYEQTAEEIIYSLDGKIDYFVAGTGTGGTITGIARKIKDKVPNCKVVGTDPVGSSLAENAQPTGSYEVEGIGYDFIPGVLDRSMVDTWVQVNEQNTFRTARQLIRHEGLLCGGSSGAMVFAALQVAKGLPKEANVVAILPDGVRNYLSKFLSNDWMKEKNLPTGEEM